MQCHLCYGTLYCWGNSTIYITSYLRQFDSSLTTHDTLPIFAGALLGQAITMPVGGYLEDVLGGQVTSLISALLIATSSFLSAQCTTVTTMLLCQLLFGVGMGTGYVPPMVGEEARAKSDERRAASNERRAKQERVVAFHH